MLTIIAAVNPTILLKSDYILYVCFVVAVLYGLWRVFPKNTISVVFVKKRVIEVKKGNIWDVKTGIIVIPMNNFLDTQVDDVVIGKSSLHGQFVKRYKELYPNKDLNQEIMNAIHAEGLHASAKSKNRKHVKEMHEDAYPLGEIVRLREGNLQYYLAIVAEFDEDNHIINQPEKYSMILLQLIKKIDRWNSGVPVYLPVIGSGQMGLSLTKQEIIVEMLSCFNLAERYVATGGTTIVVYDNDMNEISLNKIKYQFSKV